MLDFLTILSKGGIVLWYIQNTNATIASSINELIKTVILQERGGEAAFIHNNFALKYHMDNEFELVYVVGYQKVLQLSYVDKFLTSLALEFRDKYKDDLIGKNFAGDYSGFTPIYSEMLQIAEERDREEFKRGKQMRTFKESSKSTKTVGSLIVTPGGPASSSVGGKSVDGSGKKGPQQITASGESATKNSSPGRRESPSSVKTIEIDEETMLKNREKKFSSKVSKKKGKSSGTKDSPTDSPLPTAPAGKKVKLGRRWANGAATAQEVAALDYSSSKPEEAHSASLSAAEVVELSSLRGRLCGDLGDIEVDSDSDSGAEESGDEDRGGTNGQHADTAADANNKTQDKPTKSSGMFGLLRTLVGSSSGSHLTREDMEPVLDQLRDRLISKNVAMEISHRLCDSVAERLEGSQLGTFERVTSRVRSALEDACTQLLAPKRRLDVLRDVIEAKRQARPYVITFCGVNGVGKSTNLAKIAFWLIEKDFRVLIAACDTFRSGAVEQLRTHVHKLNYIHPAEQHHGQRMVELYEKGYNKDSAAIAMSAINSARDHKFDVVLVDTAGRMQDNEPLMRSLAKLIVVNNPDLVLFVGEALVGNEAVDQLVKFNQSLADNSQSADPHTIDGIVLTKFDTIDDKVGAAVSMTYISGQPIVFVGTGQTYADLRQLSASAVVKALMK